MDTELKDDTTTNSNRLSKGLLFVMTGQSNVSHSNVPEMECFWGQDEHPLLKEVHSELVTGMETRLREKLQERERVRQREARISRKMELESGWMTKRLRGDGGEHLEL